MVSIGDSLVEVFYLSSVLNQSNSIYRNYLQNGRRGDVNNCLISDKTKCSSNWESFWYLILHSVTN